MKVDFWVKVVWGLGCSITLSLSFTLHYPNHHTAPSAPVQSMSAENRLSLYVAVEELEYGKWSVLIVISFAIYKHAEGIKSV